MFVFYLKRKITLYNSYCTTYTSTHSKRIWKGVIGLVRIDKTTNKPYYEQIVLGIKEDILHGILQTGDQLPSVRELASQLLMNPNTISKAYKMLEAQDVIVTVRGKGTFVKAIEPAYRDKRQISKIQQQVSDLVIEARYLNVPLDEIQHWVSQTFINLGGNTDEN